MMNVRKIKLRNGIVEIGSWGSSKIGFKQINDLRRAVQKRIARSGGFPAVGVAAGPLVIIAGEKYNG